MSDLQKTIESLGRYKVLRVLGEGGMAIVLLAYDSRLQSHVALKVLKQSKKDRIPEIESSFLKEARVLMGMNHPHVIRVFDLWNQPDLTFIVLEYVEGTNLRQYLQHNPFLRFEARLSLFRKICTGVRAVHERSIVHRDLKPENILVSTDGSVKIADFGIVRDPSEGSEESLGTPAYMSPEQGAAGGISNRSDLYALGVIASEIFFGRRPGQESGGLQEPVLGEFVAGKLEAILNDCLSVDPGLRIPDVEHLLIRLDEVLKPSLKNRLAYFFGERVKVKFSLAFLVVSALVLGSASLMSGQWIHSVSKKGDDQILLGDFHQALNRCAPDCEKEYSTLTSLLSVSYPSLKCGDGKCTLLEGLCGLCGSDCSDSGFSESQGPKPLCRTFSQAAPTDEVSLEARRVFDHCLFSLNPDSLAGRRPYLTAILQCAQKSSNPVVQRCHQLALGEQTADPRAFQEFILCVLKPEARP